MSVFIVIFKILSPFGLLSLFIAYFWLNESLFHGKTPGKWIVKIRTIQINGSFPNPADALIRAVFHLLDAFLSLGTIGLISHYLNPHGRRLGDLVANTIVIRDPIQIEQLSLPPGNLSLSPEMNKILESFSEDQMLLIREIIDRNHRDLIEDTAEKLATKLNLDAIQLDEKEFLKEIVRHYVHLTHPKHKNENY
jgi:hypothetical protein